MDLLAAAVDTIVLAAYNIGVMTREVKSSGSTAGG
jgi:hypothetical protein